VRELNRSVGGADVASPAITHLIIEHGLAAALPRWVDEVTAWCASAGVVLERVTLLERLVVPRSGRARE
jgi:hypothetical protein